MKSKLLLLFTLAINTSFSQGPIKVQLTRKIGPIMDFRGFRFNHNNDTVRAFRGKGKKDSLVHMLGNFDIAGGDFADGKVKFTIAIRILPEENEFQMALAPYGADSMNVNGFVSHMLRSDQFIRSGTLVVVKAFGREYSASINKDGTEVTMEQLFGKYEKPDVQLYDSLMPDSKFNLYNGGTSAFAQYKHQNKYIYVIFWGTWQPDETGEIDDLKRISDGYTDALTVISFHHVRADSIVIRQIEKTKNIDWIEAKDGVDSEDGFPGTGNAGGILFDSDGKALAVDIRPDELNKVMEKLLHIR